MPKMHLRHLDLLIVLVDHLLKLIKEFKNSCKREIRIISTGMNWIKLVFSMIWLMTNTKT